MQRNQSIDLIKVIAMLGVIVLHTTLQFHLDKTIIGHVLFSMAGISMPLFFMVSGYLMLNKGRDYLYLLKKCVNIIWFVLIVTFLLDILILRTDFSLKEWGLDFVTSFLQRRRFFVFWYFGTIILLYLAVPLFDNLRNRSIKKYIILCFVFLLLGSIFQDMNITNNFETIIPQPLRFWYWSFYFMIGGLVRELLNKNDKLLCVNDVNLRHNYSNLGGKLLIISLYALYVLYYLWAKKYVGQYGIEYLFGSLPCQILSISLFIIIIKNVQIKDNKIISFFSNLFLPVYSLHMFVISKTAFISNYCNFDITSITALFYYLFVSAVTIGLSWIIMKLPILKSIFRI